MSNSIHNWINIKFSSLSFEQKLTIKNYGRPLPELKDLKTKYKKITNRIIALEVCDVLITQAKSRFSFNEHLTTPLLFQNEYYPKFNNKFPIDKN